MGMKSAPQMPPPVDTSVIDETKKKEAALTAEKNKMINVNKQGKYGTILTSGLGVEEEASTAKTMFGGTVV